MANLNATVRQRTESISARLQERANRLGQALVAVERVIEEMEMEGRREMALENERAQAVYQDSSRGVEDIHRLARGGAARRY